MNEAIYFTSSAHKERFLDIIQTLGWVYNGNKIDQDYGAALYILTSSQHLWQQASGYVDNRQEGGILFKDMLIELDLSHGAVVLVKLAANLFNYLDYKIIAPVELCHMTLDQQNFKVALSALWLRRYSYSLAELEEQ